MAGGGDPSSGVVHAPQSRVMQPIPANKNEQKYDPGSHSTGISGLALQGPLISKAGMDNDGGRALPPTEALLSAP